MQIGWERHAYLKLENKDGRKNASTHNFGHAGSGIQNGKSAEISWGSVTELEGRAPN